MRLALLSALALALPAVGKEKAATPAPEAATRSQSVLGSPDPNKEFQLQQLSPMGRSNTFDTKSARLDSFYIQQKFQPKGYDTKEFKTGGWWSGHFKFGTKEATTKGKYELPGTGKTYDTKTSPVKDARESGKTAETRELHDANRPFLGKESGKLRKPLDPTNLPRVTNEMHELKTIEDVKALLNKN